MNQRTLPSLSASEGTEGEGTRPGRTRSGTPDPVRQIATAAKSTGATKRRGPRPSALPILAEDDRRKVFEALRAGVDRPTAARYVGLDAATFTAMVDADPELRAAVETAEAGTRVANVASITKVARGGDWRAAAFLLDRTPALPTGPTTPGPTPPTCGGRTKSKGTPCTLALGWRTDHPGSGNCRWHGGSTPNGKKHAAKERVKKACELLGIPLGNGDPFELMTSAVQHAQSQLQGGAALVREAMDAEEGATAQLDLAAALDFQTETIRSAFRGGKAVVDAKVADRGQVLEDAAVDLLKAFLAELLERVPAPARPDLQVWVVRRLDEMSASAPLVH